jgi:putative transposase
MRYPDNGGLSAQGQVRLEMVRLQAARMSEQDVSPPAAWGWDQDQRWTLARVTTLIGRLFHVRYTLRCTSYLLHRIGFTPQVPVHCAVERDEDAITAWHAVTWAKVRG